MNYLVLISVFAVVGLAYAPYMLPHQAEAIKNAFRLQTNAKRGNSPEPVERIDQKPSTYG